MYGIASNLQTTHQVSDRLLLTIRYDDCIDAPRNSRAFITDGAPLPGRRRLAGLVHFPLLANQPHHLLHRRAGVLALQLRQVVFCKKGVLGQFARRGLGLLQAAVAGWAAVAREVARLRVRHVDKGAAGAVLARRVVLVLNLVRVLGRDGDAAERKRARRARAPLLEGRAVRVALAVRPPLLAVLDPGGQVAVLVRRRVVEPVWTRARVRSGRGGGRGDAYRLR